MIYKVFYPPPGQYSKDQFIACPLPCVIVVHGGQFSDCVDYNNVSGWCRNFVKMGFVAINVEYRRGTKFEGGSGNITAQTALALYRAFQDVRGAIRSIIYRQTQEGITVDDNYRIDTSRIFLAGESAGGLAVLGAAFYNQNMMNQLLPAVSPGTQVKLVCGLLDANWYNDGGNTLMSYYRDHIKGILIKSSGMYVPNSFTANPRSFFQETPFIPVIFFHGQQDATFNINSTNISFSPASSAPYNSTTYCTDDNPNGSVFRVDGDNPNGGVIQYGSKGIYDLLLQNASFPLIPSELYIDCQSGHTLQSNGTTPYLTEFGSGATSRDGVIQYMTSRAAIFFGNIANGNAGSLNKKIFIECRNKRIKCSIANNFNNNCCATCITNPADDNKCNTNQNQLP